MRRRREERGDEFVGRCAFGGSGGRDRRTGEKRGRITSCCLFVMKIRIMIVNQFDTNLKQERVRLTAIGTYLSLSNSSCPTSSSSKINDPPIPTPTLFLIMIAFK